jgi:transposase
MKRFINGEDRSQVTLLPECLDDFIGPDNPVRVVDAFVDALDLPALGFDGAAPAATGRPSYHPAVILKIYIYGYLNRVQSSRRLENECQRNVELMWLTGRLAPDFKTIADFRRDSGKAIRSACRQFVTLCRQLKLFSQAVVAIDGSKFKAVNSRERNFTEGKIDRRQRELEANIQRYLDAMDTADRTLPKDWLVKTARLGVKIEELKQKMKELDRLRKQLRETPDGQISMTDRDARAMSTHSNAGTAMVGYNVQAAVDTKHHLVVAHEVTNIGHDRGQLSKMARAAREAMGKKRFTVLADRGYFSSLEVKACEDAGIATYVARDDEYQCPAKQRLRPHHTSVEAGLRIRYYWTDKCSECPLKAKCTTGSERRVRRWEHEAVLEAVQKRLDRQPDAMLMRKRTVEHVFGTLKHWMGWTHFLTRGMDNVSTEVSLSMLAYNLKRVIGILGLPTTMKAMRLMGA